MSRYQDPWQRGEEVAAWRPPTTADYVAEARSFGLVPAPPRIPPSRCASCGAFRPLHELVRIVPLRQPELIRYACRPLFDVSPGGETCFRRATRPASEERIERAGLPPALHGDTP